MADHFSDSEEQILPRRLTVRIRQAVEMLGVSRSKIYELIQQGEIEVIKVGSSTLLPVDGLEKFVEKRRRASSTS